MLEHANPQFGFRANLVLKQSFPERTTLGGGGVALSNKPHLPVISSYKTQLLAFIIFITVSNYIQLICGLLINACLSH